MPTATNPSGAMPTAEIALGLSILALLISGATLWATHLKPFSLRILSTSPAFQLWEIPPTVSGTTSGATWWIPSFDMSLSLYNTGARPGVVSQIEAVAELRDMTSTQVHRFPAKWVLRPEQGGRRDRIKWITAAVERDWYPLLIRGGSENHLHLVLESFRWDNKFQASGNVTIEVTAEGKKTSIGPYELKLTRAMFGDGSAHHLAPVTDTK